MKEEQLLQDIVRLAKNYANEEKIANPLYIGLLMEGIRIGMARGLEIARTVHNREKKQLEIEDLF